MEKIFQAVAALLEPAAVAELRILGGKSGVHAGYFDNHKELAEAAAAYSGKAAGVYLTLNPVKPELLARSMNRVVRAKHSTADGEILRRRWLGIDLDPKRPAGIASSDLEHQLAIEKAREIKVSLSSRGWPEPIVADPGNGAHLLYAIDLPNDQDSTDLLKWCLEALAIRFSDDRVAVDTTTYNAARIWRLYGTINAKGEDLPERPHRVSKLLEVPATKTVVELSLLTALSSEAAGPSIGEITGRNGKSKRFTVGTWLDEHQIAVAREAEWNGGHKWILKDCPWNPAHTNQSAYVVQMKNGAIAAGCLHDSCSKESWTTLRGLTEPDRLESSQAASDEDEGGRQSQVQQLLQLASDVELFHTPELEAYATFARDDHRETWSMRSKQFRMLLLQRYYEETGSAPGSQAVQQAISALEARAVYAAPQATVYVRVAESDGKTYIDLTNATWKAVEIDEQGWRIVPEVPVKFVRAPGMLPLPDPVAGGKIEELRPFVNIAEETDWVLLVAWLAAGLRPRGPYPVAILHGEQGSAKSTTAKVLRSVIDPNSADLRTQPRDERDLMIAAKNAWVISLDIPLMSAETDNDCCN